MVVTHGSLQPARGRCALTIGNFDGVHRGHRALIDRVIGQGARDAELTSCVLTFEPHPREFFAARSRARAHHAAARQARPARPGRRRARARRPLRCALCRASAPSASSRTCWCAGCGIRWLLVGHDFRFGARRDGRLRDAAGARGFSSSKAMPDVEFDGGRVSSSAVRAALKAGDLRGAERLLGHPYTISGRVAHGAKLGRGLGFPTANIVLRRAAADRRHLRGRSRRLRPRRGERRPPPDRQPGADPAARSASVRSRRGSLRRASARALSAEAARRGKVRRPAGVAALQSRAMRGRRGSFF